MVYVKIWFSDDADFVLISGQQLAVFRDEKGESHVLDAYCPHMGANIAVGGRVVGDCLECPFHGWQFRGADGKVTKIPYADKSKHYFQVYRSERGCSTS